MSGDAGRRREPVAGRTGRRVGKPDTRAEILRAARAAFAESGYAATSIRRIAVQAGVDPALVHHYFGTKERVLLAALDVPLDPRDVVTALAGGPPENLGQRLVAAAMGAWESPAGPSLVAALRLALSDAAFTGLLRDFLLAGVVRPLLRQTGCPADEADIRAGLVASQMAGLLTGRYLLMLDPLVQAPRSVIVANVGATLQRYLTGPLAAATEEHVTPAGELG